MLPSVVRAVDTASGVVTMSASGRALSSSTTRSTLATESTVTKIFESFFPGLKASRNTWIGMNTWLSPKSLAVL